MEGQTEAIIVFARYPRRGQVKTRLAKTVGDENALYFYKECAERILRQVSDWCNEDKSTRRGYVFCSVSEEMEDVKRWINELSIKLHVKSQIQVENLGERLYDALNVVYQEGFSTVGVTGSDIPDLSSSIIETGFRELRYAKSKDIYPKSSTAIFGPAVDGGFYMGIFDFANMGPNSGAFSGIEWSTDQVLEQVIERCCECNINIIDPNRLPKLLDVDIIDDLKDWYAGSAGSQTDSLYKLAQLLIAKSEGQ